MIKVHIHINGKLWSKRQIEHLPRMGDEIRFGDERYAIVNQVVWCFDEESHDGQRVNIGAIELKADQS